MIWGMAESATAAPLSSALCLGSFRGVAGMSVSFRDAVQLVGAISVALVVWGAWAHTASSESDVLALLDGSAITANEIEQRANLLRLSVNITEQAKPNFQQLFTSERSDLAAKMKALQD